MRFVVDANLVMAAFLPDERREVSLSILAGLEGDCAAVPTLWPYEIASVLTMAVRRGRTSPAIAARIRRLINELPIDPPVAVEIMECVDMARDTGLSAYDAAYLVLAERLGMPLATLDERLRTAASARGVGVLPG